MDTIVYKLHNLDREGSNGTLYYARLLDAINAIDGTGTVMTNSDAKLKKKQSFRLARVNKIFDTIVWMNYHAKVKLPSYSEDVNVCYDAVEKVIKFEFSAPKLLFGNNVCEIIPSINDYKNYKVMQQNMYDMVPYWMKMIKRIFTDMLSAFTGSLLKPNWRDVEIARLDICFNQIFDNANDKSILLDVIKAIGAKRVGDYKFHSELHGIWYNSENFYFKIYDKGVDFAKHKGNIPTKINRLIREKKSLDNNLMLTHKYVDQLQAYADRILRYELKCDWKTMSYIFNEKMKKIHIRKYHDLRKNLERIFDKDENSFIVRNVVTVWTDGILEYPCKEDIRFPLKAERVYYLPALEGEKRLQKVINQATVKRIHRILNSYERLQKVYGFTGYKDMQKIFKFVNSESQKTHKFFIETDEIDSYRAVLMTPETAELFDTHGIYDETPQKQRFSEDLLNLLVQYFFENFMNRFRIENIPSEQDFKAMCLAWNDKCKRVKVDAKGKKMKKVNISRMMLAYAYIKKGTFKELQKATGYDRVSIWRLRKEVNNILGLSESVEFTNEVFLQNVSQDLPTLYFRHYKEMINGESPLNLFLQTIISYL